MFDFEDDEANSFFIFPTGEFFSPVREVIEDVFWNHNQIFVNCPLLRHESATRFFIIPNNSFQMRSGYMNLAPLTCAPRTGKIIGTIGSCMSFDACESKSDTISVPFPSFGIFGAVFFEILYFILIYLFLVK